MSSEAAVSSMGTCLTLARIVLVPIIYKRLRRSCTAELRFRPPQGISPVSGFFAVRHVRDGKDEMSDRSHLLNHDSRFLLSRSGTYIATFNFTKRVGAQFKMYFQCTGMTPGEARTALHAAGFRQISLDEHNSHRLWFLSTEHPTYKTRDGFLNHYLYAPGSESSSVSVSL